MNLLQIATLHKQNPMSMNAIKSMVVEGADPDTSGYPRVEMRELVRAFEKVTSKEELSALYDCFLFAYAEWERYEDILPCIAEEVFETAKDFFVYLITFNYYEHGDVFDNFYKWAIELDIFNAAKYPPREAKV